jgi:inner membrane transporter RhtA
VFNLGAVAKVFPAIGAAGTASLRMEFQLSYSSPFIDLIYSRLPKQWKVVIPWFVPWGHEFDFLSRHRAYSHWTGSDTVYRPITGRCFFGSKRFGLWVLLAAAGIVLIAPWTNNGINVLESYLLCWGFWAFISSWELSK